MKNYHSSRLQFLKTNSVHIASNLIKGIKLYVSWQCVCGWVIVVRVCGGGQDWQIKLPPSRLHTSWVLFERCQFLFVSKIRWIGIFEFMKYFYTKVKSYLRVNTISWSPNTFGKKIEKKTIVWCVKIFWVNFKVSLVWIKKCSGRQR